MKFWDSSALLPLLVEERSTPKVHAIHSEDRQKTVWCLTEVELESAVARLGREELEPEEAEQARIRIRLLAERWRTVISLEPVRFRAVRLVRAHPLRAADALQLAAALVASHERPEALPFVCLDDRLRDAARKEGFPVLPA